MVNFEYTQKSAEKPVFLLKSGFMGKGSQKWSVVFMQHCVKKVLGELKRKAIGGGWFY
jgi:hypothetical protein